MLDPPLECTGLVLVDLLVVLRVAGKATNAVLAWIEYIRKSYSRSTAARPRRGRVGLAVGSRALIQKKQIQRRGYLVGKEGRRVQTVSEDHPTWPFRQAHGFLVLDPIVVDLTAEMQVDCGAERVLALKRVPQMVRPQVVFVRP